MGVRARIAPKAKAALYWRGQGFQRYPMRKRADWRIGLHLQEYLKNF